MFSKRDAVQYRTTALAEIDEPLQALGKELGVEVVSFQTDCKGEMCDRIHQGFIDNVDGVIINARAWTHVATGSATRLRSSPSPS